MKNLFVVFFLTAFAICFAQEIPLQQKADDAFNELDGDKLTLRFFDALNGNPIAGAVITILDAEYRTDGEGKILFPAPEIDSTYTFSFDHPEYISCMFTIETMARSLFMNRFSISPKMKIGSLRVVIDWGGSPADLDAHLEKLGAYHISYRHMQASDDGQARLDRDDMNGFGPETITAASIDNTAEYRFFVHDFSNRNTATDKLSRSKCMVKVYGGQNRLLEVYSVPAEKNGTVWEVFRIKNGSLQPVNEIKD